MALDMKDLKLDEGGYFFLQAGPDRSEEENLTIGAFVRENRLKGYRVQYETKHTDNNHVTVWATRIGTDMLLLFGYTDSDRKNYISRDGGSRYFFKSRYLRPDEDPNLLWTVSKALREKILKARQELKDLEALALEYPELQEGYRVARVMDWDGDCDDGIFVDEGDDPDFVVVPERMEGSVNLKLLGSDAYAINSSKESFDSDVGWKLPWYGCWGESPEEAIKKFTYT